MNFDISLILPELAFLILALVLLIQSLGVKGFPCAQWWVPLASLACIVASFTSLGARGTMFYDVYQVDTVSQFFKAVIAVGFWIVTVNAAKQKTLDEGKRADYYMFLAFSAFGLMMLASSVELFTIYLALELSSYSLYAVIPLRTRSKGAAEATIKYILFGAVATALALYGLSYVVAAQHTTYITQLADKSWTFANEPMAVIGLCLFLGGMFYKLALFPFHFWAPEVYQGASNETAAYIATLPKMGAVIVLVRLAMFLKPGLEVTTLLAVLGAVSMTFGNFSALAQKDLKRLLGFSSVAHAGYVMVGLVTGTAEGLAAASFYALAYLLMNLLCFWVICRIAVDGRNLELNDLNGLYKRAPVLAFALGAGAFALVGLPPTIGFIGKFFLITAAWNHGYNWLVITLVLNSAIAIYYYLNMVRHAYTKEADESAPMPDKGFFGALGAGVLTIVVLGLGMMPAPIFDIAVRAGKALIP